jgi:hypothetical protein
MQQLQTGALLFNEYLSQILRERRDNYRGEVYLPYSPEEERDEDCCCDREGGICGFGE